MSETSHPDQEQVVGQAQFEYAWRWFDAHAKQRVAMFNYFLLAVGVLANAYGLLLREQLYWPAVSVAAIGVFVGIVAYVLDVRNHQLVGMGEKALKRVEKDFLGPQSLGAAGTTLPEYLIFRTEKEPPFWQKHKFLIRSLEVVVTAAYMAALGYSLFAALRC